MPGRNPRELLGAPVLDNHWPAFCAAAVLAVGGLLGACAGVLYVVIRPAKGEGR